MISADEKEFSPLTEKQRNILKKIAKKKYDNSKARHSLLHYNFISIKELSNCISANNLSEHFNRLINIIVQNNKSGNSLEFLRAAQVVDAKERRIYYRVFNAVDNKLLEEQNARLGPRAEVGNFWFFAVRIVTENKYEKFYRGPLESVKASHQILFYYDFLDED